MFLCDCYLGFDNIGGGNIIWDPNSKQKKKKQKTKTKTKKEYE